MINILNKVPHFKDPKELPYQNGMELPGKDMDNTMNGL